MRKLAADHAITTETRVSWTDDPECARPSAERFFANEVCGEDAAGTHSSFVLPEVIRGVYFVDGVKEEAA